MKFKVASLLLAVASGAALLVMFAGKLDFTSRIFLTENKEIEEAFIQYIAKYGKTYASKSEVTTRFNNFARNYMIVQKHNQQEDKSYDMELNQFADQDDSQKISNIIINDQSDFKNTSNHLLNGISTPNFKDWSQTGHVSAARDQEDCGSCWAHSAISSLESAITIKKYPNQGIQLDRLSIQYLVDCDNYDNGCAGGFPSNAFLFIQNNGYFKQANYYYKYYLNAKRPCMSTNYGKEFQRTLIPKNYKYNSAEFIMQILQTQPVSIAINYPNCLHQLYKGGVFKDSPSCRCNKFDDYGNPEVGHAVTLVGYSRNNNIKGCAGYWIVQNSYGTAWAGQNGYMFLCISLDSSEKLTGTCNSHFYIMYPDIGI